jgi:hypothetical protein
MNDLSMGIQKPECGRALSVTIAILCFLVPARTKGFIPNTC